LMNKGLRLQKVVFRKTPHTFVTGQKEFLDE